MGLNDKVQKGYKVILHPKIVLPDITCFLWPVPLNRLYVQTVSGLVIICADSQWLSVSIYNDPLCLSSVFMRTHVIHKEKIMLFDPVFPLTHTAMSHQPCRLVRSSLDGMKYYKMLGD